MYSTIILTKNESKHLKRAIDSIRTWCDEIFVIDSFSADDTVAIAEDCGAIVLQNKFVNQAVQFNWALENAPITGAWILRLDADEILAADLQEEIKQKLPLLPSSVVGVNLKRKHIFMDRWIKHGGRYPLIMTRIFRYGHGRSENRWMDEHIVVHGGTTVTFNGGFEDRNLNDLTFFIDKHNEYATREAIEVLNQKYGLFESEDQQHGKAGSFNVRVKRLVKEKIYNRIPFTISSTAYFLYRYVLQLGFLDGRSGLVYHFLQGYWYRFLVGAKTMEFERAIKGISDKQRVLEELSKLSGYNLTSEFSQGRKNESEVGKFAVKAAR